MVGVVLLLVVSEGHRPSENSMMRIREGSIDFNLVVNGNININHLKIAYKSKISIDFILELLQLIEIKKSKLKMIFEILTAFISADLKPKLKSNTSYSYPSIAIAYTIPYLVSKNSKFAIFAYL